MFETLMEEVMPKVKVKQEMEHPDKSNFLAIFAFSGSQRMEQIEHFSMEYSSISR